MEIRTGYARSGAAVGRSKGDLKLYYEDMGDVDDPPVLLIMGLGAQLLLWRPAFCEKLVGQGLRVIRYDNRDVGLSSRVEPPESDRPMARGCSGSGSGCAARPRTRWRTWPTMPPRCSTTWASRAPTSSGPRWAA